MNSRTFSAIAALAAALACTSVPVHAQQEPPPNATADTAPAVLVGAGDIANCELGSGHEATAQLLDGIPGTVFTMGDNAYPKGTQKSFETCYARSWGRHKARTRPTPGNHDYMTHHGAPYFDYFGDNAGPRELGYYSYELGDWHIVALNSEASAKPGSAQIEWLRQDLAAHPAECTLAYWHVPVFSSGAHGGSARMREAWRVLQAAGAEVVVNGHDHSYERFAPQDADGNADPRGIREFVVGTGGGGVHPFKSEQPNSEVRQHRSYGVIRFNLYPDRYEWEFITARGEPFSDKGTAPCLRDAAAAAP